MSQLTAYTNLQQRFCTIAAYDERIVGLLRGGSGSEGQSNEWSDIDVFFFLQDSETEIFQYTWENWARQAGQLLLIYRPYRQAASAWNIFHASPVPIRVDVRFIAESEMDSILEWSNHPRTIEDILWLDKTGGRLRGYVEQLVQQVYLLTSPHTLEIFEQYTGKLWYFLHTAYCKLMQGQEWYARVSFHRVVLDSLMALLKLEEGSIEDWRQTSFPEKYIEHVLSPKRLEQLRACIPAQSAEQLKHAMIFTAKLALEVCDNLAVQHQWNWHRKAAEEILHMLLMGHTS